MREGVTNYRNIYPVRVFILQTISFSPKLPFFFLILCGNVVSNQQ